MSARLLLLLSAIFATMGQVLFKKGMLALGAQNFTLSFFALVKTVADIIFAPVVFVGLMLYVLSTILWLFALSKTTLNYAYPFTALTFILVMASSYLVFSETLPSNRIIGGVVICIGVIIASFK